MISCFVAAFTATKVLSVTATALSGIGSVLITAQPVAQAIKQRKEKTKHR